MCVEVIYDELLYYGVIVRIALFSLLYRKREEEKKNEREREKEWKEEEEEKKILIHLVHVLEGKERT
jgi:hypothetical protein